MSSERTPMRPRSYSDLWQRSPELPQFQRPSLVDRLRSLSVSTNLGELDTKAPELNKLGRGDVMNFVEVHRESEAFLALLDTEEPEVAEPVATSPHGQQLVIDAVASAIIFFLTVVIYVSNGQAVFGQFLHAKLVFVAVETMFSGSALTSVMFPWFSGVPWATGVVDVGFLPLLAKNAEIIYHDIFVDSKVLEDQELVRDFVATFIAAQAVMFLCVGVCLYVMGRLRLTRLANFLPYPITAGLLASIGVSLAKSGFAVASKDGFGVSSQLGFLWVACTILFAGFSHVLKHRLHVAGHVATPIVVVTGILIVHGVSLALSIPHHALAVDYKVIFEWDDSASKGWWAWTESTFDDGLLFRRVRWGALFKCRAVVVAACVIGALKIGIKCGSFAAMFVASDVDVDAEMRLVGANNIVAALCASAGQAHSFAGIKVMQQLRASHKTASLIYPAWCLAAWVVGIGPVMAVIPRFVFGAMLVELGVDYVDTYLVYPLRQNMRSGKSGNLDLTDVATLVAIVVTAIISNLLEAIALGLVISLVGVLRRLSQRSVVKATRSGKHVRSTIERTPHCLNFLEKHGDAILVVEIAGYVFFGSAHELVDTLVDRVRTKKLVELRHLVLDLNDCLPTFDVTAISAFEKILALAEARDFQVLIAPDSSEAAAKLDSGIAACGTFDLAGKFYESVDDALEYAEDQLLEGILLRSNDSFANEDDAYDDPTLAGFLGKALERKNCVRAWLAHASDAHFDADFVEALTANTSLSHDVDFIDDRAMTLVVDGRIRLLNDAGVCVRKLNAGNAYAVGDYYLHDEEMYRTLHVIKASPKITVLNLKYSDLANLEQSQPHVAIHLHKLMARSLAQKNRNSKLAHRMDA